MPKLTEKQKRFGEEYLIDLNATRAAARAGYKNPEIGRQTYYEYVELYKRTKKRTVSADWNQCRHSFKRTGKDCSSET